jgi:hypothetical protein
MLKHQDVFIWEPLAIKELWMVVFPTIIIPLHAISLNFQALALALTIIQIITARKMLQEALVAQGKVVLCASLSLIASGTEQYAPIKLLLAVLLEAAQSPYANNINPATGMVLLA